ncbi:hypothetical protein M885DRAFT_517004 [Pelagophyceae sp. CCMP2097]|nr:hypothetical protein M885DRAFT_517004 [Pelagophyceae sp. CCMP2097]
MTADAEFLRLNPVAANVTAVSVSKDGGARLRRAFEAALKAHKFKVEARLIFEPNCRLEAGRWIPAAAAAGAVAADARHGSVDAATARAAQAVRRARHPQSTDAAPHGEARGGAVVLVGRAAVPVVDVNLGACVPVFDAPMVKPWEVDAVGDLKSYLAGYLAGDRGAVVALEATADAANLGGWPLLEALDALNATSTRLVLVLTGDALRRTALTPAYTHALFAQHLPRDDGTPGLGFAVAIVAPLASATLRAALPAAIRAIRAQPRASRTWRELDKLADAQNWPSQSAQRRRVYGALRNLVGPEGFEADADQFELLRRIWDEVGGPRHEEL